MGLASSLAWHWCARTNVPPAQAAVAWGEGAWRLLARLHGLAEAPASAPPSTLTVCAAQALLVVLGPADELPWVEGIAYAAPCGQAAALWCPTLHEPDVCAELLARALQRRVGRTPLLLWPQPRVVVPLDRQFPLTAETLARIGRHWGAPRTGLSAGGAP